MYIFLGHKFGKGVYFATDAGFSAKKYSHPDADGLKYMYLAQILSGDYVEGKQEILEPPPRLAGQPELYDSVVNNTSNPQIWVIFKDYQMYPEYVITFK